MKKKLISLTLILVMVLTLCQFNMTKTYAATIDEAEDYVLGETYSCTVHCNRRYFKVNIPEKSHVSLYASIEIDRAYISAIGVELYDTNGKIVLNGADLQFQENGLTGEFHASQYRVLSAGIYYLEVSSVLGGDASVSFSIQAEKQITLPKGSISSVKSSKKGQMTVKCASSDDAVGYRIQYSTSDKFKSVKTVYSPTASATVTGLKAGQRYYVKACPYTVYDDGTRVYGQNSYVKTIKIKK